MATKLDLYNSALRLIGEQPLASLAEAREPRRVLDGLYAGALLYCLEQAYWNFSIRSVEISSVPSIEPTFGYQYAFTKPDDWLRTAGIWSDSGEQAPLTVYSLEGGYLYANVTPIYWRYVSQDAQYGMDVGKWTQTFTKYVEAYLAMELCERLTQSADRYERLRALVKDRLKDAKNKDAMEDAARFAPAGSWVQSRGTPWITRKSRGTGVIG